MPRIGFLKTWVLAIRPRTLGAAIAPVLIGSSLAFGDGHFEWLPFMMVLLAAVLIQIATNLVNDYFDFQKGADTNERLGPPRVTSLGLVTPSQMALAIGLTFGAAALVGLYLVYLSGWPILLIGGLSLLCGFCYTAGPWPLAYLGGAEFFVLVFFGPVATAGTYYVFAQRFNGMAAFAGLIPGLISVGLLSVNNLRDKDQDECVDKKTLAVRFGKVFAQLEYVFALAGALLVLFVMAIIFANLFLAILGVGLVFIALGLVRKINAYQDPRELNLVLAGTGKMLLLLGIGFPMVYLSWNYLRLIDTILGY